MPAKAAFDSNVVLYLLSPDEHKAETAARLLGHRGVVSVQVLNEVANVMRRKMQADWTEITELLDLVTSVCEVRPLTVAVQQRGLEIARKHQFSIYDAMIVASAVEASCSVLYSEDMQHGFRLDELRICNPFAKALPS
jgi:pilT protein domain protein